MWTLTGCKTSFSIRRLNLMLLIPDDSAAHVSEEVTGAARTAPIAIMVGVGATQFLGWLIYIAASFATASVPDLLTSDLPLSMGQLFLDVLGKHGALAIWSCIIVVQVGFLVFQPYLSSASAAVRHRCSPRRGCLSRCLRVRQR
jgi:amino acid transporter